MSEKSSKHSCLSIIFAMANVIVLAYLWFINNTGSHSVSSGIWCIANLCWLVWEIQSAKGKGIAVYKNWKLWLSGMFLIVAGVTFLIYIFAASMP